jgi:heat-inducible transcriptional repressor
LLILVTTDSAVRQVMVHWPDETEQETLSPLADTLSSELRGLSADDVAARTQPNDKLARFVLDQLVVALRGQDAAERTEIRHSGLEHILAQPEFSGAIDQTQSLLSLLRGGAFLNALLPSLADGQGDVQVFIGGENPTSELHRLGVVVSTYGIDGEITGVVGVVGPTRMPYGRTISSVRYVSRLMSNLMADLYGA